MNTKSKRPTPEEMAEIEASVLKGIDEYKRQMAKAEAKKEAQAAALEAQAAALFDMHIKKKIDNLPFVDEQHLDDTWSTESAKRMQAKRSNSNKNYYS